MTRTDILETIRKVTHDSMPEMDVGVLSEETRFAETEIESMGLMLIICRLEAALDIRIPDEQWSQLASVKDVIDAIQEKISEKAGEA